MRVLALDYGSSCCGCALSDSSGTLASPIDPIRSPGSERGFRALCDLIKKEPLTGIVIGLPLSLSGGETAQTKETKRFFKRLSRIFPDIPIELYDERLTTKMAQRFGGGSNEDSRAAAWLLDSWLEHKHNHEAEQIDE